MIGFKANSDEILQKALKAGANVISPYYLYIKPDFVKASHANNLEVLPWVINDEKKMINMMNLDVDGIISDYPKLLFETHQKWKSGSLQVLISAHMLWKPGFEPCLEGKVLYH